MLADPATAEPEDEDEDEDEEAGNARAGGDAFTAERHADADAEHFEVAELHSTDADGECCGELAGGGVVLFGALMTSCDTSDAT